MSDIYQNHRDAGALRNLFPVAINQMAGPNPPPELGYPSYLAREAHPGTADKFPDLCKTFSEASITGILVHIEGHTLSTARIGCMEAAIWQVAPTNFSIATHPLTTLHPEHSGPSDDNCQMCHNGFEIVNVNAKDIDLTDVPPGTQSFLVLSTKPIINAPAIASMQGWLRGSYKPSGSLTHHTMLNRLVEHQRPSPEAPPESQAIMVAQLDLTMQNLTPVTLGLFQGHRPLQARSALNRAHELFDQKPATAPSPQAV